MTEPQLPIEYGDSGLVARNKINNSWTKLLEDVEAFRPSIGENGNWYIGTTDTGIHAEGYTTSFRVDSGYIQYKEENSNVWNNLIAIADLKGDTGNGIESVTATKSGKITTVTITFTEDETPYTFQISDGADGQDGEDGTDGVGIAGITTSKEGKITTVTVSYTDGSTPDNFEILDGADGKDGTDGTDGTDGVGISDISASKSGKITTITISYTDGSTPEIFQISDGKDGTDGEDGEDGVDGNGIASVVSTKSGKVTTVTMSFTNGSAPFSFTVSDGQDGEGSGDVLGPSSAEDGNIALFDGVTGKLIKDGNKKISDFATSTQGGKADTAIQPDDDISKLNNDSGFQTQQQVSSAISTATANFITKSVSDLTNYYLKSETYTQTEVNNLIGAIQQFHYEIYPNLQSVTSPASNVLYLIGPKGSGTDLYEEYVYTTQFVKIGETSIDLSQYVTITALNTALASYVTSTGLATILNDYVTTSGLTTTLADYVTNSSLATTLNNYATTTAMNQALENKITNPSGGTAGQVLTKTQIGVDWEDPQEVEVDSELSTTSENPVQNKVITNALQNVGGSSDHLEEKALVGELYTLSDDMFMQNTPALADSSVDQNVGDTSSNTQIHIQRIASGTSSNKLKLKIKKVGSPGDLTVQVMKGISVTVTANVEAYWYGDSSNIIASGTLAASNVTTSYQELEITLGANFGGTEGDLLDVVLSQSSVNASNYYVIACDSTQWSEAFSFVAVNGSTRTRSLLMPYCISDGFAQSLLCKANSDAYTINKILLDSSWSGNIYQYGQHDESIGTLDGATDVHYKITFSNDARQNGTLRVYVGSSEIYSYSGNGPITIEDDIQKEGSLAIKLSLIAGYGGGGNYETSYTFSEGISIVKNWEGQKEIKIYDVVGLGNEISAYTLGRLPDKSRWDGGLGGGAGGLENNSMIVLAQFVNNMTITYFLKKGDYFYLGVGGSNSGKLETFKYDLNYKLICHKGFQASGAGAFLVGVDSDYIYMTLGPNNYYYKAKNDLTEDAEYISSSEAYVDSVKILPETGTILGWTNVGSAQNCYNSDHKYSSQTIRWVYIISEDYLSDESKGYFTNTTPY